jgi:hypothetical protein
MVQPQAPWPKPPPNNHPGFEPSGLTHLSPARDNMQLFFCHSLSPKSAAYKIMAAVVEDKHDTLKALLADPANLPDFANGHGVTPLMMAAARNNMVALELLIANPLVNLARATPDGWTALHYAAQRGQTAATESLLKHQAPFEAVNNYQEIPFQVAATPAIENVFWAHKDFTRFMKKHYPDHPHFAPAVVEEPAPVAQQKAQPKTTRKPFEDDGSLRLDFVEAAAKMALTGPASIRHTVIKELENTLPVISLDHFIACCDTLQKVEESAKDDRFAFDWGSLFLATAAHGRPHHLAWLAEKHDIMDRELLNAALEISILADDHPHTVQTLLRLGADPQAKCQKFKSLFDGLEPTIGYQAFMKRRAKAFTEICQWAEAMPHWEKNLHVMQTQMRWWPTRAWAINAPEKHAETTQHIQSALQTRKLRQQFRKKSAGTLTETLQAAVKSEDINTLRAAYAESRTHYWNRKSFMVDANLGGSIMAVALLNEDLSFARRLILDGYHLDDSTNPAHISRLTHPTTPEPVRDFIKAHKEGTLVLPDVTSADDKMRNMQGLAAMIGPMSGRAYGM